MYQLVDTLAGRAGNNCYYMLTLAATEMKLHCPDRPPVMSVIYPAVAKQTGHSVDAVSKAVARAVTDIWERGDRKALERVVGRRLIEKPSPKDMLIYLAHYKKE